MVDPEISPFGSWKSPITSSLVAAASLALLEVRLQTDEVFWLEARPKEGDRFVVVRSALDGSGMQDISHKEYNVRTTVHDYGGGSWLVSGTMLLFSNYSDGRLYRQDLRDLSAEPFPITAAPPSDERQWRYADGVIDSRRKRWIGVREDHTLGTRYPINTIVSVDITRQASNAGDVLIQGNDFFSSPRLSPDGRYLAWLAWDLPNMPWVSTRLYIAQLSDDGSVIREPEIIAGGAAESIFQPEWSPDGFALLFASDRSGWWNLYKYDLATRSLNPIIELAADFGQAQWLFGMATYAFAGPDRLICTYTSNGLGQIAILDMTTNRLIPLATPFTEFYSVRAQGETAVFCAGGADSPISIAILNVTSGLTRVLKKATEAADAIVLKRYLTKVRPISFPTSKGKMAFGLYYPAWNPDYLPPESEKPPLVVRSHGGPTASASTSLDLGIHFWTSRGIAVVDVNYGGSTGYGREYRDRLHFNWGVVDVDDCENAAKYLAGEGLADPGRTVITGGSAGGYTTLAALTFRSYFRGGASYAGVSDIAGLAKTTHKFESGYFDWLIGPLGDDNVAYQERSPYRHADNLRVPVIFFQGQADPIVPPDQTNAMVEALRKRGTPVGYLLFSEEQHGLRLPENIQRALDAELSFYAIEVFQSTLRF